MPTFGNGQFPTTHWTLIARLKSDDTSEARRALDEICTQYHYPLYCNIRRRGLNHHDAEDALHDFLSKLLRKDSLEQVSAERGRLRGYLCVSLQRFLLGRQRTADARQQARNVSLETLPLSLEEAEQRYLKEHFTEADSPERIFERQWARELMSRVLRQLADNYQQRGKAQLFQTLRPSLLAGGSMRGEDVTDMSARLGMTANNLRVANNRLLTKYRQILEHEVAQTVPSKEEVRSEIDYLMGLFAE